MRIEKCAGNRLDDGVSERDEHKDQRQQAHTVDEEAIALCGLEGAKRRQTEPKSRPLLAVVKHNDLEAAQRGKQRAEERAEP
jgi:hypothetical protein